MPRVQPDYTVAELFAGVSKTAQGVTDTLAKSKAQSDALAERVRVGEKYLTASEEMDAKVISLSQTPEEREKAEEKWGQWLDQRLPQWTNGLSSDGADRLQEKLREKRASYGHQVRMIQVHDLQDRTNTVLLGHGKQFVDSFVRSGPDFVTYAEGPDGQMRPVETSEFRDLTEAYGHAVATSGKSKSEAAKDLLAYKQEASAAKAHSLILSRSPKDLARLKDLLAQEEDKPGTTFLGILGADRRNALMKQAKDEDYTLLKRAQEQTDRARTEAERSVKQQQENWERRTDTMVQAGTLTTAWIEDAKSLGLATDEKARFYRTAMEKKATGEEGPNDDATFRRLAPLVWSETSDPRRVLAEVQSAFGVGKLNYPTAISSWSAHLESRIKYDKKEGKTREEKELDKERTDVEEYLKILTTTTSPFEKFNPAANRLRLSLMTELGRLPRDESAKEWYFKNEAQFFGRMRGLAAGFVRTEREAMLKKDYVTVDDIAANKSAYEAKFGASWREKMVADVERLERIDALTYEIDSKKPGSDSKPGPKPAAPAANKPPSSAPPAAKPAPKPSGPLKSGSRDY